MLQFDTDGQLFHLHETTLNLAQICRFEELLKTEELRRRVTYAACSNENLSHYKNLEITLSGKLMA